MMPIIRSQATRFVALLVLAALFCVGLQAAMAKEEQTMTMSIGDYANLKTDPTLDRKTFPDIGGWQEYHHFTHLSPLITLDGDANIIPWMAKSYEVSDDYSTITFHLRKGVKFSDGTYLNASILKFNFDRILTYGFAERYGKNGGKYNLYVYYDRSEAVDENTFKIHFTKGWLDMPFDLCGQLYGQFISPLDVEPTWDIKGALKSVKMYNGLGPYYVDENESIPKQKIVLKKRNSWRDDLNFHKPKLDKIVLNYIPDIQTCIMALKKGEIDYINRYWNAPLDALLELEKNPDIAIKTIPETRIFYIVTGYWREPFNGTDGMLLRKAICYALNRTEMVEGAFNGYALPATDCMVLSSLRPDAPKCCNKGYDYNLEKAKQLLDQAGWRDTDGDGILDKDGKPLKDLDLIVTSNPILAWQNDLALVVQAQLKKIGINVKIQSLELSAYSQATKTGDYDLIMRYNQGRSVSSVHEFYGFNLEGTGIDYYSDENRTLEYIVKNAKTAITKEERDKYLCQACNLLYDEAGTIPLVYEMQYAVTSSKVKGFHFSPSENTYEMDHVEECWIEE